MNRHPYAWAITAAGIARLSWSLTGCAVPELAVGATDGSMAESTDTGSRGMADSESVPAEAGPEPGDADAAAMMNDASDASTIDSTIADVTSNPDATDASHAPGGASSDADAGSPGDASGDATDAAEEPTSDASVAAPCPYSDWVNGSCAPVCANANFGPGGLVNGAVINIVAGLSESYDGALSVDSRGRVLHLRGTDEQHEKMLLSVPSPTAPSGYETVTLVDSSNPSAYPPLAPDLATLTFDGTELIAANNSYDAFLEVPLADTQLGSPAAGHFTLVNAALPTGGQLASGYSVISGDGLTFYYTVSYAADSSRNGIYQATRSGAGSDFGAGTLLSGNGMQLFWGVTGISSDGLTLFLEGPGWQTYVLSRTNKSDVWTADAVLSDAGLTGGMVNYYAAFPTPDCRYMFASCSPGGTAAQRICEIPRLP
jgi:hypothetical protein